MKVNWKDLSIQCHNLIRAGRSEEAITVLSGINTALVPREHSLDFASLARRAGLFKMALRILKPIVVHEKSLLSAAPTAAEIGEYSISLFKMGCIGEALRWLSQNQQKENSEAQLYRGYSYMMQWNYQLAAEALNLYIKNAEDSFTKLVAKVNLSSAYVNNSQFELAKDLINQNILESEKYNNLRLKANSFELLSQIYVKLNEFEQAEKYLNQAWQILASEHSSDQLFLIKWRAILNSLKLKNTDQIDQAKQIATERKHWETVRDLDFYQLKINFSNDLFAKLYFGTPFEAYQERLVAEFKQQAGVPEVFVYGNTDAPMLDVNTLNSDLNFTTTATPQLQLTFKSLFSDLYRPRSVGALFEEVYNGQYFDVNTSPNRVHKVVMRLRHWAQSNKLPLDINFEDGGFRADFDTTKIKLVFSQTKSSSKNENSSFHLKWMRIEQMLSKNTSFTSIDLSEKLEQNQSTSTRLLKWATENKKVIRSGTGKSTKYHLV